MDTGGQKTWQRCPLQWRHNGRDRVSNHQTHDCLLNRLFRRRSKKTSRPCVTDLCAGNSPGTGEFPAQMASNAEMFPFDDVIVKIMSKRRRDLQCELPFYLLNLNIVTVKEILFSCQIALIVFFKHKPIPHKWKSLNNNWLHIALYFLY